MKLVVLASPGQSTDIIVNTLWREVSHDIWVLLEPPQSKWALLRGRAKRLGWGAVLGQVLFMVLVLPLLRRRGAVRLAGIQQELGLRAEPLPAGRVTQVSSVNAAETRVHLQRLAPDAVVLSGTRIVRADTLQASQAPVLNIHAGITPGFRGVHGGYWALWAGQPQDFGATLHIVDTGVDTGAVLAHVRPVPTPVDTFVTYPLLQLGAALPALVRALKALRNGAPLPDPVPTKGAGQQWYHPTIRQYLSGLRRGVR